MQKQNKKLLEKTYCTTKAKSKRFRKKKGGFIPKETLRITCPRARCQKHIVLYCPFCRKGSLVCDENHYFLVCDNCHHTMKDMKCYHCGFKILPSYVMEKQKTYRITKRLANGKKILVILGSFFLFGGLIWLLSLLK